MGLKDKLILWHKLVAWTSGGMVLTLASASKRGLSKAEAREWIKKLREVADDIERTIQ